MSAATESYETMRTLSALELLADDPQTTTQIADGLAIHVRTARRLLARLVHDGYAHRSTGPRPVYSLTPRFSALATRALTQYAHHQNNTPSDDPSEQPHRRCVILAINVPADERPQAGELANVA